MHPLHKLVEPIRHIISMKFQSVYPDVVHPLHKLVEPIMHIISMKFHLPSFILRQNSTFLHNSTANLAKCLQACRVVFFAYCDVVHTLHKLVEPIMHIIFKVSTLFCTTAKLNFSAQVCGKFSKVFTSL